MIKQFFHSRFLKSFIAICMAMNSFSPLAQSAPAQAPHAPQEKNFILDIPSSLGVVEYFLKPLKEDAPIIIHIRDLHASPQTQLKIKSLLEWIKTHSPEKNPSDLPVGLEGAHGTLHPEYFDIFRDRPDWNEEIVQNLFQQGELTGAELFAWEQYKKNLPVSARVQLIGVEEPSVYRENFKNYREVFFAQAEINNSLELMRAELELRKSRILSPVLQEFFREKARRKEGDYGNHPAPVQFYPYLQYLLAKSSEELRLDLKNPAEQLRFPNLVRVLNLIETETQNVLKTQIKDDSLKTEILKAASSEDQKIITGIFEEMKEFPQRKNLEEVLAYMSQYQVKSPAYEEYLKNRGAEIISGEINPEKLFSEMERIEKSLVDKWAVSSAERKLLKILSRFELLKKTVTLQLTRGEFETLSMDSLGGASDSPVRPSRLVSDILKLGTRELRGDILDKTALEKLDANFKSSLNFYRLARDRDRLLVGNLFKKIPAGSKTAVLISGGFHSDGIAAELKRRGAGIAVIRPVSAIEENNGELSSRVFSDANSALPSEFEKFKLSKQEALLLTQMLKVAGAHWDGAQKKEERGQITQVFFQALKQNSILSQNIKIESLVSGNTGAQTIVYALMSQVGYKEIWQPLPISASRGKAARIVSFWNSFKGLFKLEQLIGEQDNVTAGLPTESSRGVFFEARDPAFKNEVSRSEVRTEYLQGILNPTAHQELEIYLNEFLRVKNPDSLLKKAMQDSEGLSKLQRYYLEAEDLDQASKILKEFSNENVLSRGGFADLIMEMAYGYLFSAPAISNRYLSARYILKQIFRETLENPEVISRIVDRFQDLIYSGTRSAKALAFLIEDILAELDMSESKNPDASPTLQAGIDHALSRIQDFLKHYEPVIPPSADANLDRNVSVVGLSADSALSMAAILASQHYNILALDPRRPIENTLRQLERKEYEPGIQEKFLEAQSSGRLAMHWLTPEAVSKAISRSRVIYLDADQDLSPTTEHYKKELVKLASAAGSSLRGLRQKGDEEHRVFVFRGTFSVGSTRALQSIIAKDSGNDPHFSVVYHLDAARAGSLVKDEIRNQVVLGVNDADQWKQISPYMEPVLKSLLGLDVIPPNKLQINSFEGAELSKHALLVNMAAKQSALNEFGPIVVDGKGSLRDVGLIAGLDHRIGPAFMRPSMALGGRLLQQIQFLYETYRTELLKKYPVSVIPDKNNLGAIITDFRDRLKHPHLNHPQLKDPYYKLTLFLAGILEDQERSLGSFQDEALLSLHFTLPGNRQEQLHNDRRPLGDQGQVAILGVAYKKGTHQITESAGVKFFEWLVEKKGVRKFKIYDPLALEEFQGWLLKKKRSDPMNYEMLDVTYESQDPFKILSGNDMVLIAAPLKEIEAISPRDFAGALGATLLVDGVNVYSIPGTNDTAFTTQDVEDAKLNYLAFGSPAVGPAFAPFNNDYHPKGILIPSSAKTGPENFEPVEIAFFGAGYVGAVSGNALAKAGHNVTIIDVNAKNVASWNAGQPTFKEKGMDELLKANLKNGNLKFVLGDPTLARQASDAKVTEAVREAVEKARLLYVAVNTPEGEDGKADLIFIETVTRQIGLVLRAMPAEERQKAVKVITVKSTVPGTVFKHIADILENEFGLKEGIDFFTASNPEILVEGNAVEGALKPSRTFFGIRTAENSQGTREAEKEVENLLTSVWAPLREEQPGRHPVIVTDETSSTGGKYAANSILYLAVSLANVISSIAQQTGVNYPAEVEPVLRRDPRFTPAGHYSCGPGAGGHCFAKDAREVYVSTRNGFGEGKRVLMVELADLSNEIVRRGTAYEIGKSLVGGKIEGYQPLKGVRAGLLGLAFKDGTTDVRESPAVVSAIELALLGARVVLYDSNFEKPEFSDALKKNFRDEFARLFIHDFKEDDFLRRKFELGFGHDREAAKKIITEYFEGGDPIIRFEESSSVILKTVDAAALFSNERVYKGIDLSLLKRVNSKNKKPPFFDTRGLFNYGEISAAEIYSPGIGRPNFGIDLQSPALRSELRLESTQDFTDGLVKNLTGEFLELSSVRTSAIRQAALLTPGNLYSVETISEAYRQELGLPNDEADSYAFTFVVREILPAGGLPVWTKPEEKALGDQVLSRFFTALQNNTGERHFVLSENLKELPKIDSNMKLWLSHLSVRKNLVWNLDLDGVSRQDALIFLQKLTKQAEVWGLALKDNQIVVRSSGTTGFDPAVFREPRGKGRSVGYIAESEKDFRFMPIRTDTEFAAMVSAEALKKMTERLLASEFLTAGYLGQRYQVTSIAEMAKSSDFQGLYSALQAYNSIHQSA